MNFEQHYPKPPANVPATLTATSSGFRAQVRHVILAIFAFVITYLIMVALAIGLAWLCYKAGVFVMMANHGTLFLLVGAGVILMGALVIFFMVKFLFASSGGTHANGVQIQESDEPELFEFIRRVAAEVGTHFPRKVFLIPDVNASVFYNSSFGSLFFPTGKNLNIGLGLVNTVNVSEFKAVLAHEFGHFSQDSMKLGSYVYYVNQVIFNMLYRNNGWVNTANGLASLHMIVAFFVHLAAYIVQGVQWVLRGMYGIINRQYMSLSREMEFHADAIAASVSGSNNMAQALRQVELGSATYQQTIDKCNELLNANKAPVNAYAGQRAVAAHMASVHDLPLQQGVPVVTREFVEHQQPARINFKDQWASHPTQEEREANLRTIGIDAPVLPESAWVVFKNPEQWQQQLTGFLYREYSKEISSVPEADFVHLIREERAARDLPKVYQGYYDGHIMYTGNWLDAEPKPLTGNRLDELFEDRFDDQITALQNDIEMLNAINEDRVDTKSFDFDGQKYQKAEAFDIRQILEHDLEQALKARDQRDTEASAAFYAHALAKSPAQAEALKTAHQRLHGVSTMKNKLIQHGREIYTTVHYIALNDFHLATDMAQRFKELHSHHEPQLRQVFRDLPSPDLFPTDMQERIREVFLGDPLAYHTRNQPDRTNLKKLRAVTVEVGEFLAKQCFEQQKAILELQEKMIR